MTLPPGAKSLAPQGETSPVHKLKRGTKKCAALFLSLTDEPVILKNQIVHVAAQSIFLFFHAFSLLDNSLPDQYMRRA